MIPCGPTSLKWLDRYVIDNHLAGSLGHGHKRSNNLIYSKLLVLDDVCSMEHGDEARCQAVVVDGEMKAP